MPPAIELLAGPVRKARRIECDLVYTWRIGLDGTSSERVTVRFVPHAAGTEVSVVHENIANGESRSLHERGWIGCLDGLAAFAPVALRERTAR